MKTLSAKKLMAAKEVWASRVGVDLGGTKIEAAIFSDAGAVITRQRIKTPQGDYAAILDAIGTLLNAMAVPTGQPVGICTPGSVSAVSGVMRNANSTCLNGRALREDLAAHLNRPVRIANDANCFTLSEATDGAAAGAHSVLGVILGTGVGGGICIGRQIVSGVNGISGEWGHIAMPHIDGLNRGRACFCGRLDCIETWLSGPALSRSWREATGTAATAEEIFQRLDLDEDDHEAIAVTNNYFKLLATALAVPINILDPDVVVFGGGLSNVSRLYRRLPELIQQHIFSDHMDTRFVPATYGDSSGVRGAAWLWPIES